LSAFFYCSEFAKVTFCQNSLTSVARKGFLNEDQFGYIELKLSAPISHSPSRKCPVTAMQRTHPKNMFASIKKLSKFGDFPFYKN
jgi:hypothetical protein